jgi:5-methylcytosine-specific restriction protein A
MALSIGVSAGDKIAVGDSVVEVRATNLPKRIIISVNGGEEITVDENETHPVEILPDVQVFVGVGPGKHSTANRLAFKAPRVIPIHRISEEDTEPETSASTPEYEIPAAMANQTAVFINGVYEDTLEEILKDQQAHPKLHHYLQPYSSSRILLLAKSHLSPENPITLYFSLTHSLNLVSYRAKAVGWQNKLELTDEDFAALNHYVHEHQPTEEEIYREVNGKKCVNLISVIDVEQVQFPFHTSCLIKTVDGTPLKKRERAGNWAYVRKAPEWLGTMPEAVLGDVEKEFEKRLSDSQKDSSAVRQERLAKAPTLPEAVQVVSRVYRRNADVVAEVLYRAKGKCEECHSPAPFPRASDGSPYLEAHHRIMLSHGGEDTVENALAVCPNCHRKLHFG